MTTITAAKSEYYLIGSTPFGQHLWASRDYIRIEGGISVNSVGSLVFYLPRAGYEWNDFPLDGIVELWRAPIGLSPTLFLERIWFIRECYKELRGGQRVWKIVCYDPNYLLGDPGGQVGRIVAYNANNAYTRKLDEADNMCKAIVRENMGSLAVDTERRLPSFFQVQADTSKAPIVRKEFARRLLLPTLQEICQASLTEGTYLAFDIVCVLPPSGSETGSDFVLEFRTYIGQRGNDHRSVDDNEGVLIGPDFGNMDEVVDGVNHTAEANYIYVLGQAVGDVVAVLPAFDQERVDASPWNRREYVQNASETIDLEALQNEADAALKAGRPKRIISGTYIDSDQARFGVAWGYGDYLTAQVEGESIDCRNEAIGFQISSGGVEELQLVLRGDDDQ